MKIRQQNSKTKKTEFISAVLILTIVTTTCLIQLTQAQNNNSTENWEMAFFTTTPDAAQPIDNFAPLDAVNLQATVTINEAPRANQEVTFKITGPINASHPCNLVRTTKTDQNGIATISFRIPANNKADSQVTGKWQAYATTATTGSDLQKDYSFIVALPVIIQNVSLTNAQGINQTNFLREETGKINLTILSKYDSTKDANLTININDAEGNSIEQITKELSLNNSEIQVTQKFQVPENASLGQANIQINIYSKTFNETTLQVAETKSTKFAIIDTNTPLHDIVLINAEISANQLAIGTPLDITASIFNKGNHSETTTIQISTEYDLLKSFNTTINPYEVKEIKHKWDTTNALPGTYTIKVQAGHVAGEVDVKNNEIIAGTVTLNEKTTSPTQTSLYVLLIAITGVLFLICSCYFFKKRKTKKQNQ